MSDSIRLTQDAERQIDELYVKYDPARNKALLKYISRIPDPDDRAFALQFHQDYMRARVELFYLLRAVREYAVTRSWYHRDVLAEIQESGLAELALRQLDGFREADSELFNRHSEITDFFAVEDGDLGDGYGDSYFDQRWAAMIAAAGQSLLPEEVEDEILNRLAELEIPEPLR